MEGDGHKDNASRAPTLADAVAAFDDRRLDDAASLSGALLEQDPKAIDVWLLLAAVEHTRGRLKEAEQAIRSGLAVRPHAGLNLMLGKLLRDSHRLADAEDALREATRLDADDAQSRLLLARVLTEQRRFEEARALCAEVLARTPTHAGAHSQMSMVLIDAGRLREAKQALEDYLRLAPSDADGWSRLSAVSWNLGDPQGAEAHARAALRLEPTHGAAHLNLGVVFQGAKRYAEAEAEYHAALKRSPNDASALSNLGIVLADQGKAEEAEAIYRRAIAANPRLPAAHNNLGLSLRARGRRDEAFRHFETALQLDPRNPDYLNNVGAELQSDGRPNAAIPLFIQAVRARPDYDIAQMNLAFSYLTLGRFVDGFTWYEARLSQRMANNRQDVPELPFPEWRGESPAGKSFLLWPEQGFGDEIQFVRYARVLKQLGARSVIVRCKPALKDLMERADGVDRVVTSRTKLPRCDYWCFQLNLPWRLGTTLETIPAALPYLHADPARVEQWRPQLPAGFKVGLVWKGAKGHGNDAFRSIQSLALLAPLWRVPGVQFVSLQKAAGEAEAANPPAGQPLTAVGAKMNDFADAAAIVSQLDLVICVDTAIAHLAGALGRPTWVMVPSVSTDWRWLQDRTDSPWYPGVMRLFRQRRDTPWETVIAEVAEALREQAARSAPPDPHQLLARALAAHQQGRLQEAERTYREVLSLEPGNADAWHLLGLVQASNGQVRDAEASIVQAWQLAQRGLFAGNLARLLRREQRIPEAEEWLRRAIELEPADRTLQRSLARLLRQEGRAAEAESAYQQALASNPGDPELRTEYGMLLLSMDRFDEGWPMYEARTAMGRSRATTQLLDAASRKWAGEPLEGKSLVVWPEQGFGDNLQFVRYAPLLKSMGVKRLSWVASPPLARLFEVMDGIDDVREAAAELPRADYWTFALSLPLHLGTTPRSIPAALPYLKAPSDAVDRWHARLGNARLKIGIAWKGSPTHANDVNRSIADPSVLQPLWAARKGAVFVNLQPGAKVAGWPEAVPLVDIGPDLVDFAETAAVVQNLDLVICIDSAVAHLSGALGKRVWVMLPARGCDWRWGRERADSPWYPGVMRLFRQPAPGDWAAVVATMARALRAFKPSASR